MVEKCSRHFAVDGREEFGCHYTLEGKKRITEEKKTKFFVNKTTEQTRKLRQSMNK